MANTFFTSFFNQFVIIFWIADQYMARKLIKKNSEDEDYVMYTETNRRRKFQKRYLAAGSWSYRENQIYLTFLQKHRQLFQTEFVRRSTRVFRKMSSLLRRRDPQQCRSHHQKLINKSGGDIQSIIDKLKTKIEKQKSRQKMKQGNLKRQKNENNGSKKDVQEKTSGRYAKSHVELFKVITEQEGQMKLIINFETVSAW